MTILVVVAADVAAVLEGAWLGHARDDVAYGAANGGGARRQLQRRAAVGAIHEHEHPPTLGFFFFSFW